MKPNFQQKIRKILEENAVIDPENNLSYLVNKALKEIVEAVKSIVPNDGRKIKYTKNVYGGCEENHREGWNDCRQELLKKIKEEG